MAKLQLQRVTLSGDVQAVTFNTSCGKWLVKNFSLMDLFVSFDENFNEDEAIKIEHGMGQEIIINEQFEWSDLNKTNTIYLKGRGEVEVQQLCFK